MNVHEIETDALVVGAGPAGLALCAELLARGIETICVAPELKEWAPNYGAWADELLGLDIPVSHTWNRALVSFPSRPDVLLTRPYVRIDSSSLFARWSSSLLALDGFVSGAVASALFSGDFHEIRLDSGTAIRARQVFDASGHRPKLVLRHPMSPAVQTAFGAVLPHQNDTLSDSTMGLMLWDNGLENSSGARRIPAFDYVMPLSGENAFFEYTVLAARPHVDIDVLRSRLVADRVSEMSEIVESERCFIPMGYPVPDLEQLHVGFGGAASMVHPATGYMMARVLRTAPELAAAYVAVRQRPVAQRSRALWDVVWPSARVRTHELYRFGLEALLTMDVAQTHAFFAAFFALPDELWRPYQAGTATPREVAAAMWEVFKTVDLGLKRKLAAAGFGPHAAKLLRVLR